MRVLVCGGRGFADTAKVHSVLNTCHGLIPIDEIIHGGSTGADSIAGEWAGIFGVPARVFPADWNRLGKAAGPIRNAEMLSTKPDRVIAFKGGRGTADMVKRARLSGTPVYEVS